MRDQNGCGSSAGVGVGAKGGFKREARDEAWGSGERRVRGRGIGRIREGARSKAKGK